MLLYYAAIIYQNLIPQSDVTVLYSYYILEPHTPSQMLLYYTATVYQNLIPPVRCYCTIQLLYTRTSYPQSDVTVLYSYCLLESHTPSQMLLYYTATVYQNLMRPVRCYCTMQLLYTRTSYPSQMLLYYTAIIYQNLIPPVRCYCTIQLLFTRTSYPQSDVTVLYSYYILEPNTPRQMLLYYTATVYQNLIPPVRCYCTIQLLFTRTSYAQSDVTVLYSYRLLEPHTPSKMLLYYTPIIYQNLISPVRCYCTIQLLFTRTSYPQSDVTVLYTYYILEHHTPSQMLLYYTAIIYQNIIPPVRCYCTIQLLYTKISQPSQMLLYYTATVYQNLISPVKCYCTIQLLFTRTSYPSQMLLYYAATVYKNLIPPVRCYCTIQLLFTRTSYPSQMLLYYTAIIYQNLIRPVRCYCTIQLLFTRTSYPQSNVTVLYSYCLLDPHTPSQMLLYYTATVYQNLIPPVRCYCTIQLLYTRTSYPQSDVTVLYSYCLLEPHTPSQMLLYYTAIIYQNIIPPVRCYCTIQLSYIRTSYPQSDVTVLYSYCLLEPHMPSQMLLYYAAIIYQNLIPQSDVTVLYSYYILEPHTPSQMLLYYTATVYQNLIPPVRCYCTIQLLYTRTSYPQSDVIVLYSYCLLEPHTPSQMLLYYTATVYQNLIPAVRCYCTIQLLYTRTSYPQSDVTVLYSYCLLEPHTPSQMLLYYTPIIYQNIIPPVRCYCTIQLSYTRTSYPQSDVTVLYSYCLLEPHTPSQMLLYYTATVYQNLIPPVRCYCTIQLLFTRTSYAQSDVTVLYTYYILEHHTPSQMLLYYTATVYQNLIPPVRCYCTIHLLYTRTSYPQSDVTVLYSYCLLEPHTPSKMLLSIIYQNLISPVRCYCTIQLLFTRTSYPQSDVTVLYTYYILEHHTPSQMLLYYTAIIYQNIIPPVRCYCTIQLLFTRTSYPQSDVTVLYSYCLLEPHTPSQIILYYTATVYQNLIPQSDVTVLYSYCLLEPHTPSQMLLYYTATVYQNLIRPVRCYCTIQLLFTRTSYAQSDVTVLYSYCLLEPHSPVRCYCTIQLLYTRTSYAQSDVSVLYSYCLLEPHTPSAIK